MRGRRHGERDDHRARLSPGLTAIDASVAVYAVSVAGVPLVRIVIAFVAFVVILGVGVTLLRGLASPQPEPPPPGELRKVKLTYRCSICGAEARMTIAPNEDPEPPRHCQEEMDLTAPID